MSIQERLNEVNPCAALVDQFGRMDCDGRGFGIFTVSASRGSPFPWLPGFHLNWSNASPGTEPSRS